MLAAIAVTPSAPVLIPELAGAAAAEIADITAAAHTAAATLPEHWIAIGVGPAELHIEPDARGSFAGYGVDLPVALSGQACAPITALPLCALMAGWLGGQVDPPARVRVLVFPHDLDAGAAVARGRELRAEVDATAEPIGLLVVADGAHTLTPTAPGGHDPESAAVQSALDLALASGDSEALTRLPEAVVGRVAYQVLAGLAPRPTGAVELARAAPYGVGYFVGTWEPGPPS